MYACAGAADTLIIIGRMMVHFVGSGVTSREGCCAQDAGGKADDDIESPLHKSTRRLVLRYQLSWTLLPST